MKQIVTIILVLILSYVVFEFVRVRSLISRSAKLVTQSRPYEQSPSAARYRVLILGDSTGVGTGVSTPDKSLAGLLGAEFPEAEVINRSKNGLRSDQLAASLARLPGGRFNLIIIHIGGNDLIRFKSLQRATSNIKLVLDATSQKSDKVALFTTGDLGQASLLPLAVRPWYSYSSNDLRQRMKRLVSKYPNVTYVDLFSYPENLKQINGYAVDHLHLSDSGYQLWYRALKAVVRPLL